jgi:hypothetical protein
MARIVRGVLLTERECALLDNALMRTLRDIHMRDGGVPRELVEAAADIHQTAKEFRASVLVEPSSEPCSGTVFDGSGSVGGSSEVTERLTTQEAARLSGLSDRYWRRLAHEGAVQARLGSKGEWILDGGAVAAWLADRNHLRKAG